MNSEHRISATSVARKFWVLLGLVLALTILSSALAVRYIALPFFQDYQNGALQAQTKKSATHLNARLAHFDVMMSAVASDPDLIDVALGYSDNVDYLPDHLSRLPLPKDLSWVTFHDAFLTHLSDYGPRPQERDMFSEPQLRRLLERSFENTVSPRKDVLLITKSEGTYLVMTTPVFHQGHIEGVLTAGYFLDTESTFPANEIVLRSFLVQPVIARVLNPTTRVEQLPDFNLAFALVPDLAAGAAASNAVLTNSTLAISIVLIGAFAVFAFAGNAVIIEPHRRLAEKQGELHELASIAQRANDAIMVTNLEHQIVWANPAFETLTGFIVEDIIGKSPHDIFHGPDSDPKMLMKIMDALQNHRPIKADLLAYKADRTPYWMSASLSPLYDTRERVYGFVAIFNDITEAHNQRQQIIDANKEIAHQALHDPLTGLPNRRALDDALHARAQTPDLATTLVRIDLDHFKYVNDTMGHEAGDYVLTKIARILREETKTTDLAARVGGDEFVLLLDPAATSEDGARLAERMLTRIQEPKIYENKSIRVGASFGVASTREGLLTLPELTIGADAALYVAKDSGRNQVRLYTPELHQSVLSRRSVARELRRAISQKEFVPYFQPQFDAKTHEITGVETLARWHSSEFGLMMPSDFLPIAEQLSLVEEIDTLILTKALEQIQSLLSLGISVPKVSVNVTVERIQSDDVYQRILEHGKSEPKIAFEVLESVLVEEQTDMFRYGLDRLREAGVEIEIDDFGSGHASVVGLMHLRPDAMKIDQRLIRPITLDPLAHGLLKHIVGMAELMELQIIAEGVETMEHARLLRDIGCHVLQGYAFCRPIPIEKLRAFILQHGSHLKTRRRSG